MRLSTLKRIVVMHFFNKYLSGMECYELKRNLLNSVGYTIGEGTKVVGPFYCSGVVNIGKNCWIGKNFRVNGNGSVVIGNYCDIAPEVTFQTGGHNIGAHQRRAGEGVAFHQIVEDGVWIGGRSTVLNNSHIGSGSVIAGCSCVTKNVEQDVMVGGVPAKVIRHLDNE